MFNYFTSALPHTPLTPASSPDSFCRIFFPNSTPSQAASPSLTTPLTAPRQPLLAAAISPLFFTRSNSAVSLPCRKHYHLPFTPAKSELFSAFFLCSLHSSALTPTPAPAAPTTASCPVSGMSRVLSIPMFHILFA